MAKEGLGLEITELRLGLPGDRKRVFSEVSGGEANSSNCDRKISSSTNNNNNNNNKSQVVGWPPVCSYRKKNNNSYNEKGYVKVSMDGAPFLRKLDLGIHNDYSNLVLALENLFASYAIGKAMKDGESSEYVPIYEDKDGDWMLVGDVPWQMFIESCKRLRIMKRSEAKGLGLHHKPIVKPISFSTEDDHIPT